MSECTPAAWAVRLATADDAAEACDVIRGSIERLCGPDHRDDPEVLARWLSNKQPAEVARWIEGNPRGFMVTEDQTGIVGVGSVLPNGYVLLNYVSPRARFRGVSRSLLRALEEHAAATGNTDCTLETTVTAHAFYLRCGYLDDGEPVPSFGPQPAYPMRKRLRRREMPAAAQ